MYKLIACDLDETLLNSDNQVSTKILKLLKERML